MGHSFAHSDNHDHLGASRQPHDRARLNLPLDAKDPRSRAIFCPPEIGDWVTFRRSPCAAPEQGVVRSRQYFTGIIEISDMRAKPLTLRPENYEVIQ
ncbi:hypothetical protein [Planktotalea sp.]|uniref:hypothetical protein n=1 Tax=Planktotalea sp. TaxID=2029877 RepID=UPI003D6A254C